jgi:hypothetical protein
MKRSTAKRLHDAIQAIEAIERFTEGMDYEAYASSEMAMAAGATWMVSTPLHSPLTASIELPGFLVDERSNWQARLAGLFKYQQGEGAKPDQQIARKPRRPGYA